VKLGVTVSPRELGTDRIAIRDFLQAVEGAGYDHVLTADHVLGGVQERGRPGENVHTYDVPYYEPFVFFGFVAACTNLEVVSCVMVLPQRQTALVAKQAAQLDQLAGGRFRLGVGIGRSWMEYESLNEEFTNRGRRVEEQIAVLRALWTEELVTYSGRWHHIDRMGLNPPPLQRPIPIWMGTTFSQVVEKAVARVARLADGWFPQFPPNAETAALVGRFHAYARAAGRDPASIGIEAGLRAGASEGPDVWTSTAAAWRNLGASHLRIGLAGELPSLQARIDLLRRVHASLKGL
jgi:probable F420-dependent oxidoreductase